MKGVRLCIWRTKNFNIGGKSINDINYANISDQIKFIDTIKYYQESLASLAKNAELNDKGNMKRSLIIFFETHPKYRFKYTTLTFENRNWIIEYLSSGKGVIPYESIKSWEDLNRTPEGVFLERPSFLVA